MLLNQALKAQVRRAASESDRRRHRRVPWRAGLRGMTELGLEFETVTRDVCAGGVRIETPAPLNQIFEAGMSLVLYLEEIGRVEGVVRRTTADGAAAIQFKAVSRKRDKIADQLTWLVNRDRLGLAEERSSLRRPGGAEVIALYPGNVATPCTVVDISLFGVALKAHGPRPLIGDAVTVGGRRGVCVRYTEWGFAVDFRTHPREE